MDREEIEIFLTESLEKRLIKMEKNLAKVAAIVELGKQELGIDPKSPDANIRRLGRRLQNAAEIYFTLLNQREGLPTKQALRPKLEKLSRTTKRL